MTVTILRTTLALTLVSAAMHLLPGALWTGTAAAQATCEWYARTALRQQQQNEERKCGFAGEAWHSDLKAHLRWCATVGPDAWKAQAQARDQQLARCVKK